MYQQAVPVLQVANVETSLHWYVEVLGFKPNTCPQNPPYSFAILRRDGAEIMLQCSDEGRAESSLIRKSDPEFLWSVYLRVAGPAVLEVAAAIEKKAQLLRGPEQMFYGLVEFEVCDPDGYRICVGGEAPPGANVKLHQE
ncbi:MAG TPA: VOC family protein [Terriglobales bacterium]|nr:VOC family protein [Terriglobales bacterium]